MGCSTITLYTQHYQALCDAIEQQKELITNLQNFSEKKENYINTQKQLIDVMEGGLKSRDKIIAVKDELLRIVREESKNKNLTITKMKELSTHYEALLEEMGCKLGL